VVVVVLTLGYTLASHSRATGIVGDLNGDGTVNVFDLSILLSKWGTNDATADLNSDGTVNIFDLSTLLSHWGQTGPTPTPSAAPTPTVTPSPTPGQADAVHRIRSINVSGFNASDQFITSTTTQNMIASHSIPYLRIPFRDGWTDAQYTQMLTAVKNVHAVPLAVVHGNCANLETTDDHWLALIDQVFTSGSYYVEYGNEEDLSCNGGAGIGATVYTAGWNRDIPLLKAAHPRAKFVGPVNFQYNGPYIQTFMQTANPRPDVVSWHEYVCNTSNDDATCLSHIANWANHASDMQARMTTAGYHVPVWITEWNMDPNDEARYQAAMIQNWTSQALSEWSTLAAAGQIEAAFNYTMASHGSFNGSCSGFQLVCSDNSLTLQGQTFFGGI
jgi:hypothetical protein